MTMNNDTRKKIASKVRLVLRYPWAAALIPFGRALGVGGWIQHAVRVVTRTGPHGKDY
jgi:hypothetical protein